MTMQSLQLKQLTLYLQQKCLLKLDTQIAPGEILTVMGPSGSGKSSLLAAIAGFLTPEFKLEGQVHLGHRRIDQFPPEQRGVGLLFQDPLLFPHLSIAQNLVFAMPASTRDKQEKVSAALMQLGLAGYEQRDPETLSGGQKTRVALQRLLFSQPQAVLLDEPFSSLDTDLRQEIRKLVFDALTTAGLPAVLVTHDQADADAAGGRIINLQDS
ncbi:ATP-binding cassette domain-containing protein [Pseudohongiella nitratireducens]|uniref:ATP-binding cassette domain-containing protein n=1 Tax=Pseudohongiella nitratireducens TaxID=1768907 RepID=UPI0030EE9161|tara:strand:- start:5043 stop:5678 length:636 start_codon:yes stop_codon:yes gene_type:complete